MEMPYDLLSSDTYPDATKIGCRICKAHVGQYCYPSQFHRARIEDYELLKSALPLVSTSLPNVEQAIFAALGKIKLSQCVGGSGK